MERVSRYTTITKVSDKTARHCREALGAPLRTLPPHLCRSATYDNGTKNAEHFLLYQEIGTRSFFCDPYHNWKKGSVENRDGVIRRPFPKRTNFDNFSEEKVQSVEQSINARPMKCLDYKTPAEVFSSLGASID